MKIRSRNAIAALLAAVLSLAPAGGVAADDLRQTWEVAPDVHVDVQIVSGRITLLGIDENEVRALFHGYQSYFDIQSEPVSQRE